MEENFDKKDKEIEQEEKEEVSHFKLTLTHRNPKGLERTVREICAKVADLKEKTTRVTASGPGRMPTKTLSICTRKSPCGNGTNSYDRFELRIHKRVFHIKCSQRNFQNIISGIHTEPGMILEADEIDE